MAESKGQGLKVLLVVVLLAVAAGVWMMNSGERDARTEYNRIVQNLVNAGEYEEAYNQLRAMIDEERVGTIAAEVREAAGESALRAAEAMEAGLDETRVWLERAYELTPEKLSGLQRRLIGAPEGGGETR
ncbi:MAG: hypothetical protein RIG82_06530 [Phycisphaeraceae bacterium]